MSGQVFFKNRAAKNMKEHLHRQLLEPKQYLRTDYQNVVCYFDFDLCETLYYKARVRSPPGTRCFCTFLFFDNFQPKGAKTYYLKLKKDPFFKKLNRI
jgi:hypothetical protein